MSRFHPASESTTATSPGAAASSTTTTTAGPTSFRSTATSIRRSTGHDIGQTFKNPRLVYKNLGNGRFKDVSAEMGPGITEHFSSRGAAFGDYDNDGDIDVLILNMNDLPSLLRNDGGNTQNWIKIKLIGTKCNRTAIGARVRVVTGNHSQMDEVHSGSSVMSQCDLRLHFGLGKIANRRRHRSEVADHAENRTLHPGEGQSDPHHPRRQPASSPAINRS